MSMCRRVKTTCDEPRVHCMQKGNMVSVRCFFSLLILFDNSYGHVNDFKCLFCMIMNPSNVCDKLVPMHFLTILCSFVLRGDHMYLIFFPWAFAFVGSKVDDQPESM